jgi:hypothetical protein
MLTRGAASRAAVGTTLPLRQPFAQDGPAMLFELLDHCLSIDCRQVATAVWGAVSASAYYLSHAAARF